MKLTGQDVPEEIVFDVDREHDVMKGIFSGNTEAVYFDELAAKSALDAQRATLDSSKFKRYPILSLDASSYRLSETGSLGTSIDWEHRVGVSFEILFIVVVFSSTIGCRRSRVREFWGRLSTMSSNVKRLLI